MPRKELLLLRSGLFRGCLLTSRLRSFFLGHRNTPYRANQVIRLARLANRAESKFDSSPLDADLPTVISRGEQLQRMLIVPFQQTDLSF